MTVRMGSRISRLVSRLKKRYGALPAPPSDAFTLFVWGILTNHSRVRERDAALRALKRSGALTPEGMWKAARTTLEDIVGLVGPYRDQRLLGLRKGVDMFRANPQLTSAMGGPVPAALRALKGMPQMGEAGAYRMLLFVGGQSVLPVDARVARVATRLGYGEKVENFSKTARSIRAALAPELPASAAAYRQTYLYLEHHGTSICTETDPQCEDCPLLSDCPYGKTSR